MNILTDSEVRLTGYMYEKKYPVAFRLDRLYDEEEECEFSILTNPKLINTLEVEDLYKKDSWSNCSSNGWNSI